MKKIVYTLALFFLSTVFVLAEDILYFNNGTQQRGTVVEINTNEIKYKKAENPNGPLYIIARSEVQMIEYSNGARDIITANTNSDQDNQVNNNNASGNRNPDTYINNYYSRPNPRPQVYIQVAPPAPVWGWGFARPNYWGGGYHHHHHRRGCW